MSEVENHKYTPKNRVYHRVSECNIDETAIVKYLKTKGYRKTLNAFENQSIEMSESGAILKMYDMGGQKLEGGVKKFISQIRKAANKVKTANEKDICKIQLFLHVWYCLHGKTINKERLAAMKKYLEERGDTLSDISEALPYFAMPYVQNIIEHTFLKRIFTQEWKDSLRSMIQKAINPTMNQQKSHQQHKIQVESQVQWLRIVKDIIEICEFMKSFIKIQSIPKDKIPQYKQMIKRVKDYENVLIKNELPIKKHVQQHQNKWKLHNFELNYQLINEELRMLNMTSNYIKVSQIYHGLQYQINKNSNNTSKCKQIVNRMIQADVLLLKGNTKQYFCLEELKFIEMISSFFVGRRYISEHLFSIKILCSTLNQQVSTLTSKCQYQLQIIKTILGILHKICSNARCFASVLQNSQLILNIQHILQQFRYEYDKGDQTIELIYVSNLAVIMNITGHRIGRTVIAATAIFQIVVGILAQMQDNGVNKQIQSFMYSIIYLLLIDPQIIARAQRCNLKEILLDKMLQFGTDYHTKIVQHMIERIDQNEKSSQPDSESDREQDDEHDQTLEYDQLRIWNEGTIVQLNEEKQLIKIMQQFRMLQRKTSVLTNQQPNQKIALKQYSKQKYSRKSSKQKL